MHPSGGHAPGHSGGPHRGPAPHPVPPSSHGHGHGPSLGGILGHAIAHAVTGASPHHPPHTHVPPRPPHPHVPPHPPHGRPRWRRPAPYGARLCECDWSYYVQARDILWKLVNVQPASAQEWQILDYVFQRRIHPHEYGELYGWLNDEIGMYGY